MPRHSVIALVLVLPLISTSARAEDRAAPPGAMPSVTAGQDHGPPSTVVTSTSGVATPGPSDCGEALRRESALHQQQAAATHSLPAPLVLPPECGGTPSPSAAAK